MSASKKAVPPHLKKQQQEANELALVAVTHSAGQTARPASRLHDASTAKELILQGLVKDLRDRLDLSEAQCHELTEENAELKREIALLRKTAAEASSSSIVRSDTQPSEHEEIAIIKEILIAQDAQIQKLEAQQQKQADSAVRETTERWKLEEQIAGTRDSLDALQKTTSWWTDELEKLKAARAASAEMAAQEAQIDDAFQKTTLFDWYEALSLKIQGQGNGGPFVGNKDQLWALRNRVSRRLATFDLQSKAMEEAKAMMKFNGW